MKISVIGTGYVGLVSGVCLAEMGHEVTCVDVDNEKIEMINRGQPPIYEKGLEELLKRNIKGNLKATCDLHDAVENSELSMIAVGTPFGDGIIDLSYVEKAAAEIGAVLKNKPDYHVVVVKSTVTPGTTDEVVLPILEKVSGKKAGEGFGVGMNPEFLREGVALEDFMYPDRIVLGGIDQATHDVMRGLYDCFDGVDVLETNNKTAEMIKYTSNSLLATMISFSNEIGNLCAATGNVDTVDVMEGVHLDKRLTPIFDDGTRVKPGLITYIESGCGFGGSCFPKDVRALISYGENLGTSMKLLKSVMEINHHQPLRLISLLEKNFEDLKDLEVAVLGLAFKPGTDDMRESPAIPIIKSLQEKGARIKAYDPIAKHEAMKVIDNTNIEYCDELGDAVADVDAVIVVTSWEEFKNLPEILNSKTSPPLVVDGRRLLDKNAFARYEGIGL